jgi:WD40 repeat protein
LVAVVVSTGLGTFAFVQYQIANQQAQVAVRQSRIALARQLATQAEFNKDKGNLQEFSTLDESSQNFTLKLGLDSFPPHVVSLLKRIKPRILRFSPDNRVLAVTDDKFLHLFQINSGKEVEISEPTIIYAMNFSPDGKTLATARQDATLKLWNVETGQEIRTLKGHNDSLTTTAFSPDGKLLVTASYDKTIKLWSVETGQEIRTLKGHTDIINNAVFSPDGNYILTASEDKTAKIWDNNGRGISTLLHDRPVRLAVFTAGGNIATVSGDTVVRIFNFKCQLHPRRQDLAEWQC